MQPVLSVIIVSWNTRDLLGRCLESLHACLAPFDAQVVVVDNCSSDGTVEMVRTEFSWAEVVPSPWNLGFGVGNNLALRRARGRYVLLLNPDTEVMDGAVSVMLSFMETHPRVGVVGTTLLNADGTLQPSCRSFYSFFDSLKHNRLMERCTDRWTIPNVQRVGQPADVDWMLGACLLIRRSVLEEVGGFDPNFFVYGEEIDLQYRIRKLGWRVVYVPSNGVLHHGGQSARQSPLAASLHDYRGRWLFVRKHYSAVSAGAYLGKTLFALGVWLIYWGVKAAAGAGTDARQQWSGYWRVLVWHLGGRGLPPAPQAASRGEE